MLLNSLSVLGKTQHGVGALHDQNAYKKVEARVMALKSGDVSWTIERNQFLGTFTELIKSFCDKVATLLKLKRFLLTSVLRHA